MNGTSSVPPLLKFNPKSPWENLETNLGEEDELYVGYGHVPSAFPYKMLDMYTRPLRDTAKVPVKYDYRQTDRNNARPPRKRAK